MPRPARALRSSLCALVLGLSLSGAGTAAAAEKGLSVDLTWATSAADKRRTGALIRDSGARWVRLTLNWRDAEPFAPGAYDPYWLGEYDRALDVARRAGARVLVVVGDTPAWANGGQAANVPPGRPDRYATFVGAMAERFGDRVDAWEVWNEPNVERFWTGDVAQYVALLRGAYRALHRADRGTTVVSGGTSTSDWRWVAAAYAAGFGGSFDALAVHPYTACGVGEPDEVRRDGEGRVVPTAFAAYREVRAEMVAAGDGAKPVWATELGWSTTTRGCDPAAGAVQGGVPEAVQAAHLRRAYALLSADPAVQVAFTYNLRNNWQGRDADEGEARFGLVRTDFSPKPGYGAFKALPSGDGPAWAALAPASVLRG